MACRLTEMNLICCCLLTNQLLLLYRKQSSVGITILTIVTISSILLLVLKLMVLFTGAQLLSSIKQYHINFSRYNLTCRPQQPELYWFFYSWSHVIYDCQIFSDPVINPRHLPSCPCLVPQRVAGWVVLITQPCWTVILSRRREIVAVSEWVSSFLSAHQHIIGYSVPWSYCNWQSQ